MTSEYLGIVGGSEYLRVFRGSASGRQKLEATEYSLIYLKLKQGRYPFLKELLIYVYHLKILIKEVQSKRVSTISLFAVTSATSFSYTLTFLFRYIYLLSYIM